MVPCYFMFLGSLNFVNRKVMSASANAYNLRLLSFILLCIVLFFHFFFLPHYISHVLLLFRRNVSPARLLLSCHQKDSQLKKKQVLSSVIFYYVCTLFSYLISSWQRRNRYLAYKSRFSNWRSKKAKSLHDTNYPGCLCVSAVESAELFSRTSGAQTYGVVVIEEKWWNTSIRRYYLCESIRFSNEVHRLKRNEFS